VGRHPNQNEEDELKVEGKAEQIFQEGRERRKIGQVAEGIRECSLRVK